MIVGRKKMARRRMETAEARRDEILFDAIDTVDAYLRDRATRDDLKAAVVSARLSCDGYASAVAEYARTPEDEEEEEFA